MLRYFTIVAVSGVTFFSAIASSSGLDVEQCPSFEKVAQAPCSVANMRFSSYPRLEAKKTELLLSRTKYSQFVEKNIDVLKALWKLRGTKLGIDAIRRKEERNSNARLERFLRNSYERCQAEYDALLCKNYEVVRCFGELWGLYDYACSSFAREFSRYSSFSKEGIKRFVHDELSCDDELSLVSFYAREAEREWRGKVK